MTISTRSKSATSPSKESKNANFINNSKKKKEQHLFISPKPSKASMPSYVTGHFFQLLKNPRVDVPLLAKEWLSRYQSQPEQCMLALFDLVLKASGYDGTIHLDVFSSENENDVTFKFQTLFQDIMMQDSSLFNKDFYMNSKTNRNKVANGFQKNYLIFWKAIIHESIETRVLFDQQTRLFQQISEWLTLFSTSQYRPFRITCTWTVLELASSQCQSIIALHGNLTHKSNHHMDLDLIQALEKQIQQLFQSTFIHRYRDIDPSIRSLCIDYLSSWVQSCPMLFLDNTYLRYLGWILSDKIPEVRRTALKGLSAILANASQDTTLELHQINLVTIVGMRPFLERFSQRIIEISTRDVNESCRIEALNLVSKLIPYDIIHKDTLSDISLIQGIFSQKPSWIEASGSVLSNILKYGYMADILSDISLLSKKQKSDLDSILSKQYIVFKSLILFITNISQNHSRVNIDWPSLVHPLISSIWGIFNELSDPGLLLQYILHDFSYDNIPTRPHNWTFVTNNTEYICSFYILDSVLKLSIVDFSKPLLTCWNKLLSKARSVAPYPLIPLVISWVGEYLNISLDSKEWFMRASSLFYDIVNQVFLHDDYSSFGQKIVLSCVQLFYSSRLASIDLFKEEFESHRQAMIRETVNRMTETSNLKRLNAILLYHCPHNETIDVILYDMYPSADQLSISSLLFQIFYKKILWKCLSVDLNSFDLKKMCGCITNLINHIDSDDKECYIMYADLIILLRSLHVDIASLSEQELPYRLSDKLETEMIKHCKEFLVEHCSMLSSIIQPDNSLGVALLHSCLKLARYKHISRELVVQDILCYYGLTSDDISIVLKELLEYMDNISPNRVVSCLKNSFQLAIQYEDIDIALGKGVMVLIDMLKPHSNNILFVVDELITCITTMPDKGLFLIQPIQRLFPKSLYMKHYDMLEHVIKRVQDVLCPLFPIHMPLSERLYAWRKGLERDLKSFGNVNKNNPVTSDIIEDGISLLMPATGVDDKQKHESHLSPMM